MGATVPGFLVPADLPKTEDGIISECMEALAVSPDDKNYKAVIASSVKVQQYQYDKNLYNLFGR